MMIATTDMPTWWLRRSGWIAEFDDPVVELHVFVGLGHVLAAFWVDSESGQHLWAAEVGEA